MRIYQVPFQLDKEEKVIGGVLTLRQLIYIISGIGLGALFFILLFKKSLLIGVILLGILSCSGYFFAIYKAGDDDLDKYIFRRVLYFLKKKEYPFYGGVK